MNSREYPFELRSVSDDGLTLEGYAAVYDTPTEINSVEGHFNETIARGAFARATRANPKPSLMFDHGRHPLLGNLPIGSIQQLREDDHGLYVQARLSDNWLTEPVRDAIADGAVHGMSFRFTVPKGGDEWDNTTTPPTRTLTDVNVAELGPVVWPAYAGTEVAVRSTALAEALDDKDVRRDLAVALLLSRDSSDLEGLADRTEDVPSADEDRTEPVTEEPPADPETTADPDPTDRDESPSVEEGEAVPEASAAFARQRKNFLTFTDGYLPLVMEREQTYAERGIK